MVSLIDPALRSQMLRSGAGQGLMSLGAGLMGHGLGGGAQSLQQGVAGLGQAMDPMRIYQAQMIQNQLQQQADARKRRQAWDERVSMLPQSGIMPGDQPMLGGPLVDMPGGGTEPTQTQTAMLPPQGAQGMGLPGDVAGMLRDLGPDHPVSQAILTQMYVPPKAPKPPSAVQTALELGYERGTPQFEEFVRAATLPGAGVQVNMPPQMGPIPPGYRAIYDDQGRPVSVEPIPGSPAEQKVAETAERKAGQQAAEEENVRFLTDQIDRAISQAKGEGAILPTTGLLAPITSGIGGTTSSDLAATLETIGANISFNRLNTMRQNSKTGAGLGNVTERELDLLRNSAGSLRQTQSDEQLIENLENHKRLINRVVNKGMSDSEVNEELQKMGAMGAGVTIDLQSKPSGQKTNDELRKSLGIQQ